MSIMFMFVAGDFVKFGFPMSSAVTLLSWGLLEFKQGYVNADEYQNMLDSIKWPLDYFLKCHVKNKKFYGQASIRQAYYVYLT